MTQATHGMRVFKTLVIGLGSTGTEILEALADRIEWEVGSLDRAPWVQFLALETDAAKNSRFNGTDDFKTLTIPAAAWRDILTRPELYEDNIALSTWADHETLSQLNAQAVDAGAGNIRMVGRLALLFPTNYYNVKNAISQRLMNLRNLREADAKKALNVNNAGLEADIRFAINEASQQTGLRIIVVGTLCGGTCSGTAADMGIILRGLLNSEERSMGIFTLPHPSLSIAQKDKAELWKTNAYHALVEFNQYQLYTDTERYKSIKFPDRPAGQEPLDADATPYDLVYLVRPDSSETEDKERLTQAVADRLFLNVFVPATDPMATVVDGGVTPPQSGRAYAFATFGLSTIEYPMRRILDALKYRTLVHAVDRWKDRVYEGRLEEDLDGLGLTVEALTEALLLDEGGASLRTQLEAKTGEIKRQVRRNPAQARRALEELRSAFTPVRGEGLRGLVHQATLDNRRRAAQSITGNLEGVIKSRLLDYDQGPRVLVTVTDGIQPRVGELRTWEPATTQAGADSVLNQLDAVRSNTLLGLFFLKDKAARRLLPALSRSLDDELKSRINQKVKEALRDVGSGQRTEPGTLTLIEEEAARVTKRLNGLYRRLTNQADRWREKKARLEGDSAAANGLSLFEPSPNGTVDREEAEATDDRRKEVHAARLIRSWEALVRGVLPGVNDPDWLLGSWTPGQDNFERGQLDALEREAVAPFETILRNTQKDVVTRMYDQRSPSFNPDSAAISAATKANLFLRLNETQGQPDPMSPLPKIKRLIGRNLTPEFKKAVQPWTSSYPSAIPTEGSDPFRVVMLEEWYKFALRGVDDLRDLSFSTPPNFKTYFTRKRADIDWTPIKDDEIHQLQAAENLIFLAALHGVLRLEGGHLLMTWPAGAGENADPLLRRRRLPGRFGKAARMLAFEHRDLMGKTLTNASAILRASIEAAARELTSGAGSMESYVSWLHDQLQHGDARAVSDWNDDQARKFLVAYLTADDQMRHALLRQFPPDQNMIFGLFRREGDSLGRGISAKHDGFYCKKCGGLVGATEEEALRNGLRCGWHPENEIHPFGEKYSLFPVS